MEIREQTLSKIDDFLALSGMSDRGFSLLVVKDHNWMGRLRKGKGVSLTSIEKAEAYIAEHIHEFVASDTEPA